MSNFNDTIDGMIAERQKKILELTSEINSLILVRHLEYAPGYRTEEEIQYEIRSRTGGQPHTVTRSQDSYAQFPKCDCLAGRSGKSCWAAKAVWTYDLRDSGGEFDWDGATHTYDRV